MVSWQGVETASEESVIISQAHQNPPCTPLRTSRSDARPTFEATPGDRTPIDV